MGAVTQTASETTNIQRTGQIEWADPAIAAQPAVAPGLEFLQAMVDGEVPSPP